MASPIVSDGAKATVTRGMVGVAVTVAASAPEAAVEIGEDVGSGGGVANDPDPFTGPESGDITRDGKAEGESFASINVSESVPKRCWCEGGM